MSVDIEYPEAATAARRWVQERNAHEAPRLPTWTGQGLRRLSGAPAWIPPGTMILVRHRSEDGLRRVVTTDRHSPRGFAVEYDLGLVHRNAQPGTERLIASKDGYFITPVEGQLAVSYRALGYVEQAPLPMLDVLELRRDPDSKQSVLVAGPYDPLYESTIPVRVLGFVESYPINPRVVACPSVDWAIGTLVRTVDPERWRHDYHVTSEQGDGHGVALGGLWLRPGPGFVPLRREDGRLATSLVARRTGGPNWTARLRWTAAPLAWAEWRPRAWAVRASAGRLRALARERSRHSEIAGRTDLAVTLGYLRRDPAPGWTQVFSGTHPVLQDQYLTRSEIEASDMGYKIDGLLGYVMDRFAIPSDQMVLAEVKWASRFGQRRRYSEGPV
jgi:hypothetical protein